MPARLLEGKRFLIVEDEYLIAAELFSLLENAGATPFGPVADLERALEISAANFPLDAAILDINLQNEMVFPAAAKLAMQNIPIIFVTGYDCRSLPDAFNDAPCLTKPFEERKLLETLQSIGRSKGADARV